ALVLAGLTAGELACSSSKPKPQPPPPKPALEGLAALLPEGDPPLRRDEPEWVRGEGMAGFLGEVAPPLVACGIQEAARARYGMGSGVELVVVLLGFADPDGARCAFDLDRKEEPRGIRGVDPPALSDDRPLPGDTARVRLLVLKGSRLGWIYAPREVEPTAHAHALAAQVARALPADGEAVLARLSPDVFMVPGTARVVAGAPVRGLSGLAVVSRHECQDGVQVTALVMRLADEKAASTASEAVQSAAMEDFLTVSPFRLGDAVVLSLLDVETHRESLVIRRGRMVTGVREMASRRACAQLIEALAAIPDPRPDPPDAGTPDASHDGGDGGLVGTEDGGAEMSDGSAPAPHG
ncbi:MAG: hypothetical protein AB2A00_24385, partial [Myxococcota bacterium]